MAQQEPQIQEDEFLTFKVDPDIIAMPLIHSKDITINYSIMSEIDDMIDNYDDSTEEDIDDFIMAKYLSIGDNIVYLNNILKEFVRPSSPDTINIKKMMARLNLELLKIAALYFIINKYIENEIIGINYEKYHKWYSKIHDMEDMNEIISKIKKITIKTL